MCPGMEFGSNWHRRDVAKAFLGPRGQKEDVPRCVVKKRLICFLFSEIIWEDGMAPLEGCSVPPLVLALQWPSCCKAVEITSPAMPCTILGILLD